MPFFKTTVLLKLFYPIIILSLLTFSCSTDNSITGNTDQTNLSKPNDIGSINSTIPNIENYVPPWYPKKAAKLLSSPLQLNEFWDNYCFILWLLGKDKDQKSDNNNSNIKDSYNFRDDYLHKSTKGIDYIYSYYLLSNYGIENDLVMRHSLEHLSLMNTGIEVSRELQHGTNNNKILINRSTYDDLKDIVKIYRDSENHKDIDIVLDYLETDLEKYYNKTKAGIAADFQ
ncbi:MAG: hypothetical protein GWP19_01710 [Planctomycetia bacterium]|nr:hypothetical protein [Planctomycetia bacterium]